jgi:hypothetical protein
MKSAFDELLEEAQRDGSLIGLYVLGTDLTTWQKLFDFLKSSGYRLDYDDSNSPPPEDVREIFAGTEDDPSHLLSIYVAGLQVNCHFFWEEEIEFDIGPREIENDSQIDAVFDFMARLGDTLQKDVILTPENVQTAVVVRYDHTTRRMGF